MRIMKARIGLMASAQIFQTFVSALGLTVAAFIQISAAPAPVPFPKPYLVVEAWLDRPYVSDLYVYDLDGKQLQRLTQPPLPTCAQPMLTPEGSEVAFVANASALYVLSLRYKNLWCMFAGNPIAMAFSKDGKSIAYAAKKFASTNEFILRAQPVLAGGRKPAEILLNNRVAGLEFTPNGQHIVGTVLSNYSSSIVSYDLDSKQVEVLLSDEGSSYLTPCFTPNGSHILAIKQRANESSIVSLEWPKRADPKMVRTFPKGRSVGGFAVSFDGKSILFFLDGVLGRMKLDGTALEGLCGELPTSEVAPLSFHEKRRSPTPISMSANYVVMTDWTGDVAEVSLFDLRTKQTRILPLPRVNIRSVHLVQ